MNDSLNMGKKAFSSAVAAATILWSVGVSSFVAPLTARAASAGDVIKGETLSTVYYYGGDGSRYAFPNEKTYFAWYSDFSDVVEMTDSELAAIPLAGNIVYRPGSRWIKIQSDPKTYAVTPEGQLRWIESEEVATDLAGSDWNMFIDDVPDVFFVDYSVGTSLTDASDAYNGALVSMGGTTYLVWDGEMREVSSAGFSANMFQTRNLLDGSGMDLAGLDAGDDITAEVSELTDAAQNGGVDEVSGGLSVSLASDTPASATIPSEAASVAFTKVKLTANSGTADVSQLVFKLGGIGDTANISDAYLYEGSTRLTDARSVNSSTRLVTFSGLDISLDSGDSTYVTVRADVADVDALNNGSDTASFGIVDDSDVTSTATVSGDFPISGNTMTFSETAAGTITVTAGTDPSDPTIGEEAAEIAEFDLDADGEDASVEEITVNVDDAADHDNYELWNGSDLLASGEVSGDLVTFVLTNPLTIEDGDNETLTVSADIGGESADTITTTIEEEADIVAIGGDYGFNLAVDITAYDTAAEGSVVTIEGGELTFAFNGPSSEDIVVDGDDVVLMEFSITSANWTEVKEIAVVFEDDGEDADLDDDSGLLLADETPVLEDLSIREEDGSVWMGSEELTFDAAADDASQTITFDDNQILEAGETIDLMITADVSSDATATEVFHAELDMSLVDAEDSNGDALATTDIVPTADIIGNDFTVTDSSLTLTLSTPPSTGTYVKGATGVSVLGLSFEAGDAEDVTVNEVLVYVQGDDDGTWSDESDIIEEDYVSSCSAYDNESGALVDGPVSVETNLLTFENMDWTVEAGETAKLLVKCDFSNQNSDFDADTVGDNDDYVFFVEAGGVDADQVDAEDESGDDVAIGALTDAQGNDPSGAETVIINVNTAGTMTITASGSTPNDGIILGASTGVEVSKFKFAATNQSFVVNSFSLQNCIAYDADEVLPCDGVDTDADLVAETSGTDAVASAVVISYTDSTGAAATDTGYLSSGVVTFDNLDLLVSADTNTTVTVTVDTNSVSTSGGATSGNQLGLIFIDDEFDADGVGASNSLDDGDVADVAEDIGVMTLRKTQPTFSLASGSPSGSAGMAEALRFNVAVDSRGYVTLDQIMFKVDAYDSANSGWSDCDAGDLGADASWELYDYSDSSTKLDVNGWSFVESDGSACEADDELAYAILDFDTADEGSQEIGAGDTVTYVLKIDKTNAASPVDNDNLTIEIPDESETSGLATAQDAIQWEDDSAVAEIDGTNVDDLPVSGTTIEF